jgi:hypothetical protein
MPDSEHATSEPPAIGADSSSFLSLFLRLASFEFNFHNYIHIVWIISDTYDINHEGLGWQGCLGLH